VISPISSAAVYETVRGARVPINYPFASIGPVEVPAAFFYSDHVLAANPSSRSFSFSALSSKSTFYLSFPAADSSTD